MPLRNATPVTFRSRGLSDCLDSTNLPPGAMRSLSNLIPNPTTRGTWICRPACIDIFDFEFFSSPGAISGYIIVGDILYGMIASNLNPGKDQPFAIDLRTNTALPVQGVTNDNTPASPPTTGDWTPPIFCYVATSVIVTHPGFPGGNTKFGWFDVSGFSRSIVANTLSGTPYLTGLPNAAGFQPGYQITGTGIAANTRVVRVFTDTQFAELFQADSNGTTLLSSITPVGNFFVGMTVTGPGVQDGTTVVSIDYGGNTLTLSQPTTENTVAGTYVIRGNVPSDTVVPAYAGDFTAGSADITNMGFPTDLFVGQRIVSNYTLPDTYVASISAGPAPYTVTMTQAAKLTQAGGGFSGAGTVIEMSQNATITGTAVAIGVAGGTTDAPLWNAGDTQINNLPSVPVGVAQMNGRAYYACGTDGIAYSDSLAPIVRTNSLAVQALNTGDGIPVTAIAALSLGTPLTGGTVIALIAFQRDEKMQQITGDQAFANLAMNPLPVKTGTHAPNSIADSAFGLFFVSPEGLRLIDRNAQVSDPIGVDGDGIVQPFLDVTNPPLTGPAPASRIAAAANGRTLRIDVPTTDGSMACYWFDLARRIWTGPHTCLSSHVKSWSDTFIIAPFGQDALLQRSDDIQQPASIYIENGVPMTWEWETSLLPDTGAMSENAIMDSTIAVRLAPDDTIQINFLNELRFNLDGVTMAGWGSSNPLWGTGLYGDVAGPTPTIFMQRSIQWTIPLVFKQGAPNVRGLSSADFVIGNFYMEYQILRYTMMGLAYAP